MLDNNDIAKNLTEVEEQINRACQQAGRLRKDVRLIAVSKGQDFTRIRSAYNLGVRNFGESYAQELIQKIASAQQAHIDDIRWHFIGSIQSNKIKMIKNVSVVHSIGSIKHAYLLDSILSKRMDSYLQVNLDGCRGRSGFLSTDILDAISSVKSLTHLRLKGLMTILPLTPKIAPDFWFKKMIDLKRSIISHGLLDNVSLSMGMSGDFEDAIFYGANDIRIGSKIFGSRSLSLKPFE